MSMRRRTLLKALGALGCAGLPAGVLSAVAASTATSSAPPGVGSDICSASATGPLYVPNTLGWFAGSPRMAPR
jgi:hypothetical protein